MVISRYILVLILALGLLSCGGSKKVSDTKNTSVGLRKAELSEKENAKLQYKFFEANKMKIIGNIDEAEELFLDCIKIDKNNDASYFELAKISNRKKDYLNAIKYAKLAVNLAPNNEWYGLFLAQNYEYVRAYEEASKIYEKQIKKGSKNRELYYYWINSLIYSNQLKKAIEAYDLLEEKTGISEEVSFRKEKIYLELKDNKSAIKEIEKLLETDKKNTKYLNILAELYQMNKQPKEATEIYNRILELDPKNAMVHLALSEQYTNQGDTVKAYQELKKVYQDSSFSIDAKVKFLLRYFTYNGIKESKKIELMELSRIVTEVHPNDAKGFSLYGDVLYRADSLKRARESYRKGVVIDESVFAVWGNILDIDITLNDNESLYEDSEKAIELFPSQPAIYLFNGIAGSQLNKTEKAIKSLLTGKELVFDNQPLLAQFYATLGDAYQQQKEFLKSDSAYDKCLELDPKNVFVLNNYAYYLSLRNENLEKALEMSKKSNELQPNSQSFADTYAWILYQMKQYEEAKVWMEKAIEYGGESGTILEHYGDVLYRLDKKEEALKQWGKAKELKGASDKIEEKVKTKTLVE